MSARPTSNWFTRASALAMGAVLASVAAIPSAMAQSFNGSGTVVAGSANINTGAGTTDVSIFSPQAVIDWTPSDVAIGGGAIDFQSAGTTATFNGFSDFAVLNRIVPVDPTRPVQFNGTINGTIGVSVPVTGGKVYFYSPGGIILGANARVDVGALGLSTADPVFDLSTGDFVVGGAVTYNAAVDGTAVQILSGAQITAPVDFSSYVAVFAPVIRQDGLINVNGSTALVAGGAGTLTWNSGLFDVQVTVGTDGDGSGIAINHSGNTGGAIASGGGSDLHRVYMVAVPKNSAITTMINAGSMLGFDIAGAADTFGNTVVLSAGYDQSGDFQVPSSGAGSGAANITVTNTGVSSNLIVNAKGTSLVRAASGGITALASDAHIQGGVEARLESSGSGSSLTLAGNLSLTAANFGDTFSPSVTGGIAYLASNSGASLMIGGSAFLDASASSDAFSVAGNATGGTARVDIATGGLLSIGSDLFMSADGMGSGNGPMGNGTGGLAEIVATGSGASINIGGALFATARGVGGGSDGGQTGFAGGDGFGGTARIIAQGGNNITVQGMVDVRADGEGGDGNMARSGDGTGGLAVISAGTGSMLDLRSDVTVAALGRSGFGFNAQDGGNGFGGTAVVETTGTGAVVLVGNVLLVDSNGLSDGTGAQTGNGGNGTGGTSTIRSVQGSITVSSIASLQSDGQGGTAIDGAAGIGRGGRTALIADQGGSLNFNGVNGIALFMQAQGTGGSTSGMGNGGLGIAGMAEIFAMNGGAINTNGGDLEMLSAAFGGDGANGGDADGRPGFLTLSTTGGSLNIGGNLIAVSSAAPGVPTGSGNAGASFGGSARLALQGGAVNVAGTAVIDAPGTLSVFADGGNLNATGLLLTAGDFVTDAAGTPASAGTLSAGTVTVLSNNNIILGANLNSTASPLTLNANGLISVLGVASAADIFVSANGPVTIGQAQAANRILVGSSSSIAAGPLQAGQGVDVQAAGNASLQSVNAGLFANIFTPGLLSISGTVAAPLITIGSSDINIGAAGGLNAGPNGTIEIYATNSAGVGIGDGVSGGYLLDNSEFGRIRSGMLTIGAEDLAVLPIDMQIGNLDVAGPLAGGNIGRPDGSVTFITGDIHSMTPSGTIRVVGSLRARGFTDSNALVFNNAVTEVDAERGMIEILGSGTDLAGTMEFLGQRVHVAQVSILDQLRQDPFYAGRADDLNTPLATPRPDGVLRAHDIGTDNATAILIQNTGSLLLPAGIIVFSDEPINFDSAQAPGSVELIVNGQLLTPSGLITGVAVHDHLIDDANRGFFTASSTVNGCLVSQTACLPAQQPSVPQADDFVILDSAPAVGEPEPEFDEPDSEEQRQAEEEGAEASKRSPIAPPAPLISTRPLDPPVNVDEPVAGSGNPALIGGGGQP
jgi:filamentous hemagglutinin family protein